MDFLQSEQWRKFQEAVGRRTFFIAGASIIEHKLPIIGNYFYIPRGPVGESKISDVVDLAKKEKAGWIRIDVDYKNSKYKIVKAPHDMQPKEIFVVDISKSEEELLKEMKEKTRYNIKLAQKRGVKASVSRAFGKSFLEDFLRLVKITSKRQGIKSHLENYYRQMFETIPSEIIKLYVAEYENKIIAANIMIFYGDTAIYLHGASDNKYRNVMAPYLLQWQQMLDAKKAGCIKYDFGGVKTEILNSKFKILNEIQISKFQKLIENLKFKIENSNSSWQGITKFKTGFSPNTQPIEFSGSYDIVINPVKYYLYRIIQKVKSFL